jgi:Glycosyl hydrolase family 12
LDMVLRTRSSRSALADPRLILDQPSLYLACWRSRIVRLPRRLAVLLAFAAAFAAALATVPSSALAGGVPVWNSPVCGDDWVTIQTPQTYYHVYNDDFGRRTCINAEHYYAHFAISAVGGGVGYAAYPNISSGWESGRYSCTGHTGACYAYPVQGSQDGDPRMSMAAGLAPGRYDLSWDVWTNRTDAHPVQDDGTEVMIWLAHPGIREGVARTVAIDGIWWDVTTWIAHHNGSTWRLLIYYAAQQRSSAYGLRLNDFFREAETHGEMSASYWLTGIDAGFELVSGGLHDNIHYYSLTDVR